MSIKTVTDVLNMLLVGIGFISQTILCIVWIWQMYHCGKIKSQKNIETLEKTVELSSKSPQSQSNKTFTSSDGDTSSIVAESPTGKKAKLDKKIVVKKKINIDKTAVLWTSLAVGIGTFYTYFLTILHFLVVYNVNIGEILTFGSLFIFSQRYFLFLYYLRRLYQSFKGMYMFNSCF